MSRKKVARNTKSISWTITKKSSVKAASPSVPRPGNSSTLPKGEIRKAADGARSKTTDRQLVQLERGRTVKQLFERGYSHEMLAVTLRRKKSLVRGLIILGGLFKDLEEAYLQGKINRKEALKLARARKEYGELTAALTLESSQRILGQDHPPEQAVAVRSKRARQGLLSLMSAGERQEKTSDMPSWSLIGFPRRICGPAIMVHSSSRWV